MKREACTRARPCQSVQTSWEFVFNMIRFVYSRITSVHSEEWMAVCSLENPKKLLQGSVSPSFTISPLLKGAQQGLWKGHFYTWPE